MFNRHSSNMKQYDSLTRLILAILLTFYALNTSDYYILILAVLLYYTAYKKFCFAYFFFKINEQFSINNYYSTFLPKHNPSPVLIFDIEGNVLFKNAAADDSIECNHSVLNISKNESADVIRNDNFETIMFECKDKTYQIQMQGISKEKFLLAYFTDVTEVVQLNDEIEDTQREIIYTMGEIGETRSKETGNHVKRVAKYSELLALLYGLSKEDAAILKMASPMHDIGKVGIPDAILNAPRKLDLEEWKIMQTHAQLGYEMLKTSTKPILKAAAIVANEHHEKFNGSGYPNATKGGGRHSHIWSYYCSCRCF